MTNRIHIGSLNGEVGIFISQPGDDVYAPTKSRLLDTRFETLDLHVKGSVNMQNTYYNTSTLTATIYYSEITFPDLGYTPIFHASFYNRLSGLSDLPVGSCFYPTTWGQNDRRSNMANALSASDGQSSILRYTGAWLANNTTLRAKVVILDTSNDTNRFQFCYMIFKNRGA
ncbi:hypothetical protein GOZ81_21305 [Agrobacterium vitis]|uniref:hypothetical protein n=1 Tax=Agrobacterium vitis TaxID=373 RepID=UPI0012E7CC44|nr:hypothetical protein [Agrobacterium vitis]MVA73584.1 hypothetical protein [Agrobacterium vitis]